MGDLACVGLVLTDVQWASASGLGEWTVRELYAHVGRGVTTTAELVAVGSGPELPDAASYFLALRELGPTGAVGVAAAAKEWAAERDVGTLVGDFDGLAAKVVADVRAVGTGVVTTIAGTMRMSDYVLTRVLEATVHLLDLVAVVPGAAEVPEAALRRAVDVLTDLTPPAELIALATGRPSGVVFPVLT
ncbi:maleylpyruvate isomerase N-terminal domain-containing protein [Umezawaea sp. Da 62-37]|uniref:maleylpyruvate isomerase N-terminal domain-containing protein n=1 Tax=Umezawaea sp. Da 62-37 TaxID=3075927 RepID=UPI0028F715D7|nr:maleylpyruvate isomerase N-terminal domain-containing protein [Umezawaea sp. Da 62-37]WNV85971.1 maleylpyruvate isomerase N-terminal domain-containing protein [Umezawaea sp. Da 62-37]